LQRSYALRKGINQTAHSQILYDEPRLTGMVFRNPNDRRSRRNIPFVKGIYGLTDM
jgi:hypothetical protein